MNKRKVQILQLINEHQFLSVTNLSECMGVSEVTIRKDLQALDQAGLIIRKHGGASALLQGVEPFATRQSIERDEKYWLAKCATDRTTGAESLLIDAGTTPLRVAELLKERKLTVVTNSLPVACELVDSPGTVHMTGGMIFGENMCLVGPEAEEYISKIRVDCLILGASGVKLDQGPMTSSSLEANVKRKMIEAAEEVILVMDHSKLTEGGLITFASFQDIDVLITSVKAPPAAVEQIRSHGVEVLTAEFGTAEEFAE